MVLSAAFDLKVSFGVEGKAPAQVPAADVLGFITAQRYGGATAVPVVVVEDADRARCHSTPTLVTRAAWVQRPATSR